MDHMLDALRYGHTPNGHTPIFVSPLLDDAKEVTRRVEWITRNGDGTYTFNHGLRKRGSEYQTQTVPAQIFKTAAGIFMSPRAHAAFIAGIPS